MKKLLLSLLATSLLFSAEYNEDDSTEEETLIVNQTIVNNIISADTKKLLLKQNVNKGVIGTQYYSSDNIKIINIPIGFNIGNNFALEVNTPIVNTNNDTGLGDISIGGNYFFNSTMGSNTINFLYKTTTGDENKNLGSGASAYSLTYILDKKYDQYNINYLLNYTLNSSYQNITYGDSYMLTIGGSMPINSITATTKLSYFHSNENDNNGFKYGKIDNLDLWLQADFYKSFYLPINLGLKLPLINKIDSENADKTISFYIGATKTF